MKPEFDDEWDWSADIGVPRIMKIALAGLILAVLAIIGGLAIIVITAP